MTVFLPLQGHVWCNMNVNFILTRPSGIVLRKWPYYANFQPFYLNVWHLYLILCFQFIRGPHASEKAVSVTDRQEPTITRRDTFGNERILSQE